MQPQPRIAPVRAGRIARWLTGGDGHTADASRLSRTPRGARRLDDCDGRAPVTRHRQDGTTRGCSTHDAADALAPTSQFEGPVRIEERVRRSD
jgi:hypothetical protein